MHSLRRTGFVALVSFCSILFPSLCSPQEPPSRENAASNAVSEATEARGPTQKDWGDRLVQVFQIFAFVATPLLGLATYLAARDGFLNAVNTEYQKRVMDRLSEVIAEVYAEFDPEAPEYWLRPSNWTDVVESVGVYWAIFKGLEGFTIRDYVSSSRVRAWERRASIYSADPFLPPELRDRIVHLVRSRGSTLEAAVYDAAEELLGRWGDLEQAKDEGKVSYFVYGMLRPRLSNADAPMTAGGDEVIELRDEVQAYLRQFDVRRRRERTWRMFLAERKSRWQEFLCW